VRSTVDVYPHDMAVIEALETIGHPVGFGQAPPGALEGVVKRTGPDYLVLYPLGSARDGNLGDPWTDAALTYQVTVVGRTAPGVRWLLDKIEPALLAVAVPGRAVRSVTPEDDSGVRPDFDTDPPVLIATPRFRILTVPA